ncbi:MAG: hypothetical protein VKJ64_18550, partial [Leptolyngbyaceae bacterium]|nr:hypothetical protein [Leptolyngbyaceae bacterium]
SHGLVNICCSQITTIMGPHVYSYPTSFIITLARSAIALDQVKPSIWLLPIINALAYQRLPVILRDSPDVLQDFMPTMGKQGLRMGWPDRNGY